MMMITNEAMRPAHMALHLAAMSGRATEQPDISAPVGVCRYCLLHCDIAAQRGLFPIYVQFVFLYTCSQTRMVNKWI
jgi:hypothetical protein